MIKRPQLELSLSDVLSKKINQNEDFTVSTESRFGTRANEVFCFDLKRKMVYYDYARKSYDGKTFWFHETREFIRLSMIMDLKGNIRFNLFLVPETREQQTESSTTLHFDFFSTGTVEKVI